MVRLYVHSPLLKSQEISVSDTQSHYLQKVMRLKAGDDILVFNGTQGEWLAKITETLKKSVTLILLKQTRPQEDEGDLWLLFSPLKSKYQAFLEEKVTELGAARLYPVRCERTVVSAVNLKKMEAHLIEAAEQSHRLTVPEITPLTPLLSILDSWPQDRLLLFGDESLTSPRLSSFSVDSTKRYAFLVGPEGGFTPQELSRLKTHPNCQGVTLNPHILRAETAALVGVSYLQLR